MHMEKLISELRRLYLPTGAGATDALSQHILGHATLATSLAGADGRVRSMVIPFDQTGEHDEAQHWTQLCAVANALQAQLGFPAPAVSISGANGYRLWLSLESPVPVAQAQAFLGLLRQAYFPEVALRSDAAAAPVQLPPCLNPQTGKWSAFIHPGMGASFAGEAGLDMAPPLAGQAAFLEGLHSIGEAQFLQAIDALRSPAAPAAVAAGPAPDRAASIDGLLLKDATLEDIVRFLHAKHIEPTFRHLIPPG
jgi:hypothetical protein